MAFTHIAFAGMPFVQSPSHTLERKKTAEGRPAVLLEFLPGFVDPNPCLRSHVIYVLEGELELELRDGPRRIRAGEACWLDQGTEHRASNPGSCPTVAFIVSDLEQLASTKT
jgi:hypothetical protein